MRDRTALSLRLLPPLLALISGDLAAQGRSPFTPPAAAAPAAAPAPAAGGGLEYRGNIDLGDGVQFRLFDPSKKTGVWVRLNQRNEEFDVVARNYDDEQKALTVEQQGRSLTLPMRVAKVVSGGAPPQMPSGVTAPGAPAPAINVAPAVTQSVVVNPTPADEQRRLEAVAAEVARRRALREQAAQQVNPTVVPLPAPAQPQAR
jgi:hypothetical protein